MLICSSKMRVVVAPRSVPHTCYKWHVSGGIVVVETNEELSIRRARGFQRLKKTDDVVWSVPGWNDQEKIPHSERCIRRKASSCPSLARQGSIGRGEVGGVSR